MSKRLNMTHIPNSHCAVDSDESDDDSVNSEKIAEQKKEEELDDRLCKRLCYVLRYGALKEGLTVYEGDGISGMSLENFSEGFVDLKELMALHIMRHNTEEEVIKEVNQSLSGRNVKRFEYKEQNERKWVRSRYARRFEKNPFHEDSHVLTLLETCIQTITSNLNMYDLEDFPDEFLISSMLHRLKRKKKLNNQNLRLLLVPALTHLDLEGDLYVTESTLKYIMKGCPNLKVLSLKDCGYVMTDNLMMQLLKRLPQLESINLASCKHLTDNTIHALCRYSKNLQQLNISWIRTFSEEAVLKLIRSCDKLQHLDMYNVKFTDSGRTKLVEIVRGKPGLKIVLKGLTEKDITHENPSEMLPNFGKVWY